MDNPVTACSRSAILYEIGRSHTQSYNLGPTPQQTLGSDLHNQSQLIPVTSVWTCLSNADCHDFNGASVSASPHLHRNEQAHLCVSAEADDAQSPSILLFPRMSAYGISSITPRSPCGSRGCTSRTLD